MNTGFANEPLKVRLSHSEHTRFSDGEWSIESTPFVIQKLKGSTLLKYLPFPLRQFRVHLTSLMWWMRPGLPRFLRSFAERKLNN